MPEIIRMTTSTTILLVLGFTISANAQIISFGCPSGWLLHDNKCYKFVDDEMRVYEEADADCWRYGARLLSVNTYAEHKFVSDWLMKNNAMRQTRFFTSGYYYNEALLWEGDNSIGREGEGYWITVPEKSYTSYRVVYAYGASSINIEGYGWKNATASQPSNYICEIDRQQAAKLNLLERDFDYGHGITDPREIHRGPQVDFQPTSIVVVDGAVNVEIECGSIGNPYPGYTWWKTNQSGVYDVQNMAGERYTLSGGRFTIQDPKHGDIGDYYCRAENEIGRVLSNKATLIFGYLESFQNIEPQPVYAQTFKGTKMSCSVPSHSPGVTYEWFKNAATNIFIYPGNPNIFVSYSGYLYFTEVQPTDANKRYFCVVTLIPTGDFVMSNANPPSVSNLGLLMLLTSGGSTDNDYGPIINTHAFPSPALVGHTIRLECIAYGTHPLFYSWKREDGRPLVPGTKLTHRNRVLTITNPTLEAEGGYVCICKRGTGAVAEKVVNVFMEAKPYFPFPMKNIFADPGMTLEWYCKAVGRPKPNYSWYKNGVMLKVVPGQIEIYRNVLTIRNVDENRDEGMYQCAATNQHGTTFSSGQLKVLLFTPNFNRYPLPPLTMVPLGGNMTIPCSVEGAPTPIITWLKNGGDMGLMFGDTSGRIGMDSKYGLVLTNIDYSDNGRYTCKATNAEGDAFNTTVINVAEQIQISQPPSPTSVQVNRTAFLYCQANYNSNQFDLVYVWKFNGRVIDYELTPEYILGMQQNVPGLYVTHAQYKHDGLYECEAKTTLHTVSRSALMEVNGPPGPPAGVYADDNSITEQSVMLIWTVSMETTHGGPITGYDIEAETNYHPGVWEVVATDIPEFIANQEAQQQNKRIAQRAIVVRSLIPNTNYKFRVRSVNMFGRGQEASKGSSSIKIASSPPIISPLAVGGGGGKVGVLTVSWKPLDISERCGPGLGYYVYWKKLDDNRDWKKELATDNKAMEEGKYIILVGLDNYYLEYTVKVAAFNDLGHGPNSTEQVIFSAEGMPNSVPSIQDTDAVNATSIIAYWTPVPDDRLNMKGRVMGYRVYYYEDLFGDGKLVEEEPDPTLVHIETKDVYGQVDHAALIGLTPNAEYYFRVQVFNTAGYGPKGEWRWGETNNPAPTDYPTHVAVYPHGQHSVRVRWRGISTKADESSLEGYILRVWKVQEDVRTATDYKTDKVTERVIEALQIHTVYIVRVLGFSAGGDGHLSESVYFTVLGGNIPFDPTTSQICYSDLERDTCGASAIKLPLVLMMLSFCSALYIWNFRH